jgi:hypothetical protein
MVKFLSSDIWKAMLRFIVGQESSRSFPVTDWPFCESIAMTMQANAIVVAMCWP